MIALIDMDSLVYRAFPGRKLTPGREEFTEEEDEAYKELAWQRFQKFVKDIEVWTFCSSTKGAVGGEDNFRDQFYPDYKISRRTGAKTIQKGLVREVSKRAVEVGMAVPAHGREADDLIRIWAEECREANEVFIVCSIDKDLGCIPGTHCLLHDPRNLVMKEISEIQALRTAYGQLLSGDSGDDIPGLPRWGPVTASKAVIRCANESAMRHEVIKIYKAYYGDDWYQNLKFTGTLTHIQKTTDDVFEPFDWPESEVYL